MTFDNKLLGKRINEQRKKLNITQEQLAEMLGKSVPLVYYYSSGKRVPPPEVLYKLSKILNVSSDYLLGLTDHPFPLPTHSSSDAVMEHTTMYQQLLLENNRLKEVLRTLIEINADYVNAFQQNVNELNPTELK
ncbi:MAG TPA: helix-turn-helix transcriptional regulator [Thermotogota bacterium]|nr:helix-turn-helix transcriptional regulator [Thermotogota bacterium]